MPAAHRHSDSRYCGATTVVTHQGTVTVNGQLWAVNGDENTHGGGALSPAGTTVTINNLAVVVSGDLAAGDLLAHLPAATAASGGSGNVSCY